MLLQALYQYAQRHQLLEDLPIQIRTLHALVEINADGSLRSDRLSLLTHTEQKGKKTTERPGQDRPLPRFPGENNGGKSYFLASSATALFGRKKETGEALPTDSKVGKNPTKEFLHFWQQVTDAYAATQDPRLYALLEFRRRYIAECDGNFVADLPFLKERPNKKGEPELVGLTGQNDWRTLKSDTIGFAVDGIPLDLYDRKDALTEYWFSTYTRTVFSATDETDLNDENENNLDALGRTGLCLLTGELGQPIARSHKPKILGVPGLTSGGYVVSFAQAAPAFSSYGFEMGQNAPISESAVASYALGLNKLLASDDHHRNIGPLAVCFWAKCDQPIADEVLAMLADDQPRQSGRMYQQLFAGAADDPLINGEELYSVALAGNAGRVVIRHWLQQPLREALTNIKKWQSDLEIAALYRPKDGQQHPYRGLRELSEVTLRRSKQQKSETLIAERIVLLYRAALEGMPLPIILLQPVLQEFQSALVKNSDQNPTYPFSQSRFALIKCVLLRNQKEGDFMPQHQLAETPDPAYNLGRLLAVFGSLQDKYHNYKLSGASVVERYYGTASSAPASAFPILCRLARHHLSKVRKEDEGTARAIEARIRDILGQFEPQAVGKPPAFPRLLPLEEQGRFALGFYQQKCADAAAIEASKARKNAARQDA